MELWYKMKSLKHEQWSLNYNYELHAIGTVNLNLEYKNKFRKGLLFQAVTKKGIFRLWLILDTNYENAKHNTKEYLPRTHLLELYGHPS